MQSIILAGGKGTRLLPLTINTPKPIVPICNRPFLLYQIDMLKKAGIKDIILSLGYKPEKIEKVLGDGSDFGVNLRYVVEPEPLGTAGAFKFASQHIADTIVVLNGDSLTDLDLTEALNFHFQKKALATIVLTTVNNPSKYGLIEINKDASIYRFVEKPRPDEITCNTVNAGIYILATEILNLIPANQYYMFENGVFPAILDKKLPFFAYLPENTYWQDIGTPQSYLQSHFDLMMLKLNGISSQNFSNSNLTKEFSNSDEVSIISKDCEVEEGAIINCSSIGEKCFIGKNSYIENSVILPSSRIEGDSHIKNSIIGNHCLIEKNSKTIMRLFLGDSSKITSSTFTF